MADTRAQIVEFVCNLLTVLALSFAPAVTLALTFALAKSTTLAAAKVVVNFSLELVYGVLGVEDALCDLELATRTKAELMVLASRTRNGGIV